MITPTTHGPPSRPGLSTTNACMLLLMLFLLQGRAGAQGSVLLVGGGSEEYNDWSDRPYRSRTTVTIQLGVRTRCTLTIHDILGRQVALLADGGELGPGRITFSWDAPGAASGTYLVRLRSAGTVTTVPVQLLR